MRKWKASSLQGAPTEYHYKAADKYEHINKNDTHEFDQLNEREDLEYKGSEYNQPRPNRAFRPPSFSGPDVGQEGFSSRHAPPGKHKVSKESARVKTKAVQPEETKQKGDWKELVFKIKLTPEEYSNYLHDKSKRL